MRRFAARLERLWLAEIRAHLDTVSACVICAFYASQPYGLTTPPHRCSYAWEGARARRPRRLPAAA